MKHAINSLLYKLEKQKQESNNSNNDNDNNNDQGRPGGLQDRHGQHTKQRQGKKDRDYRPRQKPSQDGQQQQQQNPPQKKKARKFY